jgi:calpain-15
MELSDAELVEIGKQLFVSSILASVTSDDLEKIRKWCEIDHKKYTDNDFPSSRISLYRKMTSEKSKAWKKFVWRRASEFMTEGPIKVFEGGITPDDIRQGALGDAYFLCALTILAEKPSRIERLFVTRESNEAGAYAVELCVHGQKQVIVIDDFFPCTSLTGGPCFSKANGSELWVMILEKAWAKVYGSYERIERGTSNGALRDLTGAPTVTYKFEDGTWDAILEGVKNEFIVCAAAGSNKASQQILEGIGLIGNLTYAVIHAQEVQAGRDGTVRLVKLRNPWSNAEWQGDWSDSSSKWTPQLKKLLNFTDAADGTFWMSFDDFKDYFSTVTICRINDTFTYKSLKVKQSKVNYLVFDINVARAGFSYISVDQMERCCFALDTGYQYSNARMILLRESKDGLVYVEGKSGVQRNLWIGSQLEAGKYKLYVEAEWRSIAKTYVVSAYGSAEVGIESLGQVPEFLRQVFVARSNDYGVEVALNNGQGLVKYHEMLPEGYGYFFVTNNSKKTLTEKCYFKSFKALTLLPPFEGAKYEITLQPGDFEIIILRASSTEKFSLSFTSKVEESQSTNPLHERIKSEGTAEKRSHPSTGKDLGIQVYVLKTDSSLYLLYENTTKNINFDETIDFTLRNAKIVGVAGKSIEINLPPGGKFLVEVQSTGKSWSVQRSSSFSI